MFIWGNILPACLFLGYEWRYFEASRFQTMITLKIFSRSNSTAGFNGAAGAGLYRPVEVLKKFLAGVGVCLMVLGGGTSFGAESVGKPELIAPGVWRLRLGQ